MFTKNIAIVLAVIALLLIILSVVNYVSERGSTVSSNQENPVLGDEGDGKIGVTVLPPEVEDKKNGS